MLDRGIRSIDQSEVSKPAQKDWCQGAHQQ
jgi:hypothetical protein